MKQKTTKRTSKVSAQRVESFIRSRFNPIRTLTPQLMAQYLDEFKAGYLRSCALMFDAIEERDDTLKGVAGKRKKAAARNGWEILSVDGIADSLKSQAEKQKEVLLNFYNNISVTSAIDLNQRGQVSLLVRQMMDAVGKLYAVHEIVWQPGEKLSAQFRFTPLWFFENTTGALRFLPGEFATAGEPLEENGWLVTCGDGLMPACAVAYIYKTMSLKDWVIYNGRHGMPGIHGKTDAQKGSAEWEDLVTAVQNFAADMSLVTNTSASIEKIDVSATGQLPYPPLVERMDRALAALWRGADLSTMSGGKSDAGQGASLQGDESMLLEADDAQLISEALNLQVDKFVLEYTFGPGVEPLVYFKLKTTERKNVAQEIQKDQFLLTAGAPLGKKNTLERYNRPMPDADEELLQPTSVPASLPGQQPSGDTGNRPGVKTGVPTPPGSAGSFANSDPSTRQADPPALGRLMATARDQLAVAQDAVLQPLRAELERILSAPDSDLQSELSAFRSRLPDLLKSINASPETAIAFESMLSTALLSGMEETVSNFDPSQPRDEAGQWTDGAGGLTSGLISADNKGTIKVKTPKNRKEAMAAMDDMRRIMTKAHAEVNAGNDPTAVLRFNHAVRQGKRLLAIAESLRE